jgi:acetyl esterase/lipase
MRLDPDLAAYLARVARELPPPTPFDIPACRARMEAIQRRFPPPVDTVQREDHVVTLPGRELRVRVYRPVAGTRPLLVYFHGGGWVAGSVLTHDGVCAALAQDAQLVVASVDYRLAPEDPFPRPNDDAFAALEWAARNARMLDVDAARLSVGGDSAGAHLAAGLALEARDRGVPLAFQLLIYPVIEPDFETASYREHAVSATLTRADMIDYWKHYLCDALDTHDPRAVPSRAASHAGLPPAHVVVAELDPLRDEGVRYAGLLRGAGVPTLLVEAPHLAHGFLRAAPYAHTARAAQAALGVATGRALGTLV